MVPLVVVSRANVALSERIFLRLSEASADIIRRAHAVLLKLERALGRALYNFSS